VGRDFVSGFCKLKSKKTLKIPKNEKPKKNLKPIFLQKNRFYQPGKTY